MKLISRFGSGTDLLECVEAIGDLYAPPASWMHLLVREGGDIFASTAWLTTKFTMFFFSFHMRILPLLGRNGSCVSTPHATDSHSSSS